MFVYACAPIDFWAGWMTEVEFLQHKHTKEFDHVIDGQANHVAREYAAFTSRAYALAKHVMWEGDMREGPFIAGLPYPDNASWNFIVAWKQDNNGTTFVASEQDLEWLRKDSWWASIDDRDQITLCDELGRDYHAEWLP